MKNVLMGLLAVVMTATFSCKKNGVDPIPTPPPVDTVPPPAPVSYLTLAKETHGFIAGNLLTQYGSYRANTTNNSNIAFEWYTVSQLYADAAMFGSGDSAYLPLMKRTFQWMENMWDKADPYGGYFAACNLDGSGAGGDKFVDDNGLTGMVFLEAYDLTTGADKQAYLDKAKACADWIINSGLWDENYGGGLWRSA